MSDMWFFCVYLVTIVKRVLFIYTKFVRIENMDVSLFKYIDSTGQITNIWYNIIYGI